MSVNHRRKTGISGMSEGMPAVPKPLGVQVHLLSMPSSPMMLDSMRDQAGGKIEVKVRIERATDLGFPNAHHQRYMVAVSVNDKEGFRTTPSKRTSEPVWNEDFLCTFSLAKDTDIIRFSLMSADKLDRTTRGTVLATCTCPLGLLRSEMKGPMSLRLRRKGETAEARGRGMLMISMMISWKMDKISPKGLVTVVPAPGFGPNSESRRTPSPVGRRSRRGAVVGAESPIQRAGLLVPEGTSGSQRRSSSEGPARRRSSRPSSISPPRNREGDMLSILAVGSNTPASGEMAGFSAKTMEFFNDMVGRREAVRDLPTLKGGKGKGSQLPPRRDRSPLRLSRPGPWDSVFGIHDLRGRVTGLGLEFSDQDCGIKFGTIQLVA